MSDRDYRYKDDRITKYITDDQSYDCYFPWHSGTFDAKRRLYNYTITLRQVIDTSYAYSFTFNLLSTIGSNTITNTPIEITSTGQAIEIGNNGIATYYNTTRSLKLLIKRISGYDYIFDQYFPITGVGALFDKNTIRRYCRKFSGMTIIEENNTAYIAFRFTDEAYGTDDPKTPGYFFPQGLDNDTLTELTVCKQTIV